MKKAITRITGILILFSMICGGYICYTDPTINNIYISLPIALPVILVSIVLFFYALALVFTGSFICIKSAIDWLKS